MGREIQDLILYHINSHRTHPHNHAKQLILHDLNSYHAQKDAQYVLEEMLKCNIWDEEAVARKFKEVSHKNPFGKDYCCELTDLILNNNSLDLQIQKMIWDFLSSKEGHREELLNDSYTHAGVEIAHNNNINLTVLTVRLSRI